MYDPPSQRERAARALRPPSWYAARSAPRDPVDAPDVGASDTAPRTYLTTLAQPFDDPYEELCRSFNVHKTTIALLRDGSVPATICMRVRRDAHMPTHGLVVLPSNTAPARSATPSPTSPSFPSPLDSPVLPVNLDLFVQRFTYDLLRLSADDASAMGTTLPVPFYADPGVQAVELPTITLSVPHPPSAPLLLFFGLGLALPLPSLPPSPNTPECASRRRSGASGIDAHTGLFATFLLPAHVVAEFPAGPAMAAALLHRASPAYPTAAHSDSGSSAGEDTGTDSDGDEPPDPAADLRERTAFVGGLWANVLALGPRDGRIVDMVRCAWNVCREAQRLRGLARRRAS